MNRKSKNLFAAALILTLATSSCSSKSKQESLIDSMNKAYPQFVLDTGSDRIISLANSICENQNATEDIKKSSAEIKAQFGTMIKQEVANTFVDEVLNSYCE